MPKRQAGPGHGADVHEEPEREPSQFSKIVLIRQARLRLNHSAPYRFLPDLSQTVALAQRSGRCQCGPGSGSAESGSEQINLPLVVARPRLAAERQRWNAA